MKSNKKDVKLELELSEEEIEEYAKSATQPSYNHQSKFVVIGSYESYRGYANSKNYIHFHLSDWNYICDVYGYDTAWKINEKFLQMQVDKKKEFISTCNPNEYSGITFQKEIQFLKSKGYIFRQSEDLWISNKVV